MEDVTYALQSFDGLEWHDKVHVGNKLSYGVEELDWYLSRFPNTYVRLVMLENTGDLLDVVITVPGTIKHY